MIWEERHVLADASPAPERSATATAPDGSLLTADCWHGRDGEPQRVQVSCEPPLAPEVPYRFPTVEEVISAVNEVCLAGAVMSMAGGFLAGAPEFPLSARGAFLLEQVAATPNTAAALALGVASPGGLELVN